MSPYDTHEWQSFLQAVIAGRDSDVPRLIAADWLEDQGEGARAEFIRVQCELAVRESDGRDRSECSWGGTCCCRSHELRRRERELLDATSAVRVLPSGQTVAMPNWQAWSSLDAASGHPIFMAGDMPTFRRGFVAAVTLAADDWLHYADALTVATPLEEVTLTTWPDVEERYDGDGFAEWALPGRDRWYSVVDHGHRTGAIAAALLAEWPAIKFTLPQ